MFEFLSALSPQVTGSLISGGASLIGGLMGNEARSSEAAAANAASAASAERQMQFQREMSDTSYQRAVADMRAAGINPMLAAMRGGASTPGGASYTAQMPQISDVATPAVQSGIAAYGTAAQARKTSAEAEVVERFGIPQAAAQLDQTIANTGLTNEQKANVIEDTKKKAQEIANLKSSQLQILATTEFLKAQTETEAFKQLNYKQQTAMLAAQTKQIFAQAALTGNQVEAELASDNLKRKLEEYGPVGKVIGGVFTAMRSLMR